MPSQTEIELTFLARALPAGIIDAEPEEMLDVYIPETSPKAVLRARRRGGTYEITKKVPVSDDDYSVHTEQTIPLDKAEFDALEPSSRLRVSKRRYKIVIDGYEAEVDVFDGPLEGLVLIDFEFTSVSERDAFTTPACCLADVTQEFFVLGGQLAGKQYSDIEGDLKRFNYQKIVS